MFSNASLVSSSIQHDVYFVNDIPMSNKLFGGANVFFDRLLYSILSCCPWFSLRNNPFLMFYKSKKCIVTFGVQRLIDLFQKIKMATTIGAHVATVNRTLM